MSKFKQWIRNVLGIETVHVVDMTQIYKTGMVHLPKNVVIKLPSLTDRIKSIPYKNISDNLLYEIWEKALNEMNRRKAADNKQEERI